MDWFEIAFMVGALAGTTKKGSGESKMPRFEKLLAEKYVLSGLDPKEAAARAANATESLADAAIAEREIAGVRWLNRMIDDVTPNKAHTEA